MAVAASALALGLCLSLSGCGGASPRQTFTKLTTPDPAGPYLGRSKDDIVACAGAPFGSYKGKDSETLTYHYKGAGPVPAPASAKPAEKKTGIGGVFAGAKGQKKDDTWECTASLVFENNRLVRVNYAHREVASPYAWQSEDDPKKKEEMRTAAPKVCTFSLPTCG